MQLSRWFLLRLFLATSSLSVAACSSKPDEICLVGCLCASAAECAPGYVCEASQCVPEPEGAKPDAGGGPPVRMDAAMGGGGGADASTPAEPTTFFEPFRLGRFSGAKPPGWQIQPAPAQDGLETGVLDTTPAEKQSFGLSHMTVTAALKPFVEVARSRNNLQAEITASGYREVERWSCCLVSHSHWALALVETGQADLRRFAYVLATTNRQDFGDMAIESLLTLFLRAPDQVSRPGVQHIMLNIAQSLGLPNDLTPQALEGSWESVEGNGYRLLNSSGNYVGGANVGVYRLYTFQPGGRFQILSAAASQSTGNQTVGLMAQADGRFSLMDGVLMFHQDTCVTRIHRDGVQVAQEPCSLFSIPPLVRVERTNSPGGLLMSGIGLNLHEQVRPVLVRPAKRS